MKQQLALVGVDGDDAADRVGRAAFSVIISARNGNPGFKLTQEALISALRPALAKEMPKQARVNGRNILFDALAAACGITAPFTRSAAGQVAKALKEIREINPAVSAADIKRVAKAVRSKYENAGPMGVSAHWHEFASVGGAQRAANDEPANWRDKWATVYPDISLPADARWSSLTAAMQKKLRDA